MTLLDHCRVKDFVNQTLGQKWQKHFIGYKPFHGQQWEIYHFFCLQNIFPKSLFKSNKFSHMGLAVQTVWSFPARFGPNPSPSVLSKQISREKNIVVLTILKLFYHGTRYGVNSIRSSS